MQNYSILKLHVGIIRNNSEVWSLGDITCIWYMIDFFHSYSKHDQLFTIIISAPLIFKYTAFFFFFFGYEFFVSFSLCHIYRLGWLRPKMIKSRLWWALKKQLADCFLQNYEDYSHILYISYRRVVYYFRTFMLVSNLFSSTDIICVSLSADLYSKVV